MHRGRYSCNSDETAVNLCSSLYRTGSKSPPATNNFNHKHYHVFRPNDGPGVDSIRAVADDIKCSLQSEIIGIGVAQDADGRQQICDR
jgi:hypothetical protein